MKKQLTQVAIAISLSVIAWSCNQSDPKPKGNYVDGVFVLTIGNWSDNNGSLSFFKREETTADMDVFSTVNGANLKGGVQGYAVANDRGAITVDNSALGQDKVEIVNAYTFEKIATIGAPDIENPRKVVFAGSTKAYVSCWGANGDYTYQTGYIAVIDLKTNKVIKKIEIPKGPENLLFHDNKLFVGTTSYTDGKELTVINTSSDEIIKTISFDAAPAPIGIDANGKLWVGSKTEISKIDPSSYAKATFYVGADASKTAENFALSADLKTIYFVLSYYNANYEALGETYKFNITDTQVNINTPFIKRVFSGLAVDPKQGLIYAAVTPSPVQSGYAVRYRTDGTKVDSIKVGASPIGFLFQ